MDGHTLFVDCESKDDLAINFHKKIYMNPIDNQRLVKPVCIIIKSDFLQKIQSLPRYNRNQSFEALKIFITEYLKKSPHENEKFEIDESVVSISSLYG